VAGIEEDSEEKIKCVYEILLSCKEEKQEKEREDKIPRKKFYASEP